MTITFPRQLPTNSRMQECWFELMDNVASQPFMNGNKISLSQVNDPTWKGTFQSAILSNDDNAVWSSWKNSLRGGLQKFIAYDVRRPTPIAYPTARTADDIKSGWDGTVSVTALGLSGALSLAGLPDSYQFKAGDRVGLQENGYFGYYEIMEDVVATGTTATITVAPFLHTTVFDTSAVGTLWRPWCKFMIDGSSWVESGTVENSPISFNAVQAL